MLQLGICWGGIQEALGCVCIRVLVCSVSRVDLAAAYTGLLPTKLFVGLVCELEGLSVC